MAQRKYDQALKDQAIEAVVAAYKRKNDLSVIPKTNETLEQENARLKKELAKARMERDLLKKATAYFASLEK
jgi:transposase